jgi:hypothetical protein
MRQATWLALLVLLSLLVIGGCGYRLRGAPRIDAVRVGPIVNETTEPALEDRLADALVPELLRYGVSVRNDAAHAVTGRITQVALKSLAEEEDVTTLYEVTVRGIFFLEGPGQELRELRRGGVFLVTFGSRTSMDRVAANKEQALDAAIRNMATELVASILALP